MELRHQTGGGQCIWEAGVWPKSGEGAGGDLKFIWDMGGRLREFSRRDVGVHSVMITRRRDVGKKQVWDAGCEGKNVWDVGIPIAKAMGGSIRCHLISENKLV